MSDPYMGGANLGLFGANSKGFILKPMEPLENPPPPRLPPSFSIVWAMMRTCGKVRKPLTGHNSSSRPSQTLSFEPLKPHKCGDAHRQLPEV